jgi:hypothetical protein
MHINAISHYLPTTRIPNEYYAKLLGLSDKWIYRRSGIRLRTRADTHENTNTMSVQATKAAIERLPYPVKKVDLIVGATYTPYDTVGTLAHAVQRFFGIPEARVVSVSSALMFSSWIFFGRRSVRALFHKASFISGKKFREGPHKHHVRRLGVPELERQPCPFVT